MEIKEQGEEARRGGGVLPGVCVTASGDALLYMCACVCMCVCVVQGVGERGEARAAEGNASGGADPLALQDRPWTLEEQGNWINGICS